MKKIKYIKENEEFSLGDQVFSYCIKNGSITLNRVRQIIPKITGVTVVKPEKKGFTPPTLDEVKDYFKVKGYTSEAAVKFHEYYSAGEPPWSDGKGKPIRSWKQKAMAVWFREEHKIKKNNEIQKIDFFGG